MTEAFQDVSSPPLRESLVRAKGRWCGQNRARPARFHGPKPRGIGHDAWSTARFHSPGQGKIHQASIRMQAAGESLHSRNPHPFLFTASAGPGTSRADRSESRPHQRLQPKESPHLERMGRVIELTLFRVMQESLTNIQRHSGSSRATIRIQRSTDLTLEISDYGSRASARLKAGRGDPSQTWGWHFQHAGTSEIDPRAA
jgi:hypothetical protein